MQAYQLLEMGKVKEAQKLIPIEILILKSDNLLLKNKLQNEENKELVENAKVRIEALKLDVSNPDRFDLIEDTYESVIENAFLCCDSDFIYDYSSFLDDQNDSPKAYEIGKRLEGFYLFNKRQFKQADFAYLYNLLGIICGNLSLTNEQEIYHKKAIEIREQLTGDNSERYNAYLAMSYNNAGVFYNDQGKTEQAEYYYKKAIEIYESLAGENPERYNVYLAVSYYNYGIFTNKEEHFDKALDLAKTQPDNPYCRKIISALED